MNTTATSFSSEHSTWCTPTASRRCSTESILSIQGKETDFVCDTTDTEPYASDRHVEYEPVTDDDDAAAPISTISAGSSGPSEDEIIRTKVIRVSVRDDRDMFADTEDIDKDSSDSELDMHDYWRCAQCHATNNTPLYRYCQKCFQVRKNFFPPRPKRKRRQASVMADAHGTKLTELVDSGIDSGFNSQELSQDTNPRATEHPATSHTLTNGHINVALKRRRFTKCKSDLTNSTAKNISDYTDSESDDSTSNKTAKLNVQPLVKTVSDPQITVESDSNLTLTKKALANSLKVKVDSKDLCITCFSEPKSGVFVHGRVAHICCCYKCAVKVWATARRCPLCNSRVSNVLKAVVM